MDTNVIEGAVKSDKLAGIDLQDLGDTMLKQFRNSCFDCILAKYPNSGALRRLLELHEKVLGQSDSLESSEIRVKSLLRPILQGIPLTFPAIAGILVSSSRFFLKRPKRKLLAGVHQS